MRILILAAGYGTRLYPLTLETPKALLSINKKPILNHLLEKIDNLKRTTKIDEIVIVSNDKFHKKFLSWRRGYNRLGIKILNDGSTAPDNRRGAIRDIELGIRNCLDDWLIFGSDNLFDWELKSFVTFSLSRSPYPTVGIYDVKKKKMANQLGIVEVSKTRVIKEFWEKPKRPRTTLIATCIYFFPKESLKFIDEYLKMYGTSDMIGQYIGWLVNKTKVYAFLFKGNWIDIGSNNSLREAERLFKKETEVRAKKFRENIKVSLFRGNWWSIRSREPLKKSGTVI
jgi:glucose-1-phosphate thymidylyltransferase